MDERDHPLKRYRLKHQVPLAMLAKAVGTSRQSLFRIEAGAQSPSLDLIVRICAATNGELSANDFVPNLSPVEPVTHRAVQHDQS